jgi:hypothetical protein
MTAKESIIEMVKMMPDDVSAPDIAEKLYLHTLIDRRIQEVEDGDAARSAIWTKPVNSSPRTPSGEPENSLGWQGLWPTIFFSIHFREAQLLITRARRSANGCSEVTGSSIALKTS